jgi:hypothetical protein
MVKNYPSQAEGIGLEQRTVMHFLNRTANQLTSSVVIFSMMTAAVLLGMPGEIASFNFYYVFVNAALRFVANLELDPLSTSNHFPIFIMTKILSLKF